MIIERNNISTTKGGRKILLIAINYGMMQMFK
jgi:hypothetical protein